MNCNCESGFPTCPVRRINTRELAVLTESELLQDNVTTVPITQLHVLGAVRSDESGQTATVSPRKTGHSGLMCDMNRDRRRMLERLTLGENWESRIQCDIRRASKNG